jgi:hypothetical protein
LTDVGPAIGSEIKVFLVDGFDVIGDPRDILDGPVVRDDHVLHLVIPQPEIDKLPEKAWAHDLEFSSENMAGVDVAVNRRQQAVTIPQQHANRGTHLVYGSKHSLKPSI